MAEPEEQRAKRARLDRLIPANIEASAARSIAERRERLDAYDAMALSELREVAMASLTAAAATIASTTLTGVMLLNGWTQGKAAEVASHLLGLVQDIDIGGPASTTNMSMWFDFAGITLQSEDELKAATFSATEVYNAYIRRKWRRHP